MLCLQYEPPLSQYWSRSRACFVFGSGGSIFLLVMICRPPVGVPYSSGVCLSQAYLQRDRELAPEVEITASEDLCLPYRKVVGVKETLYGLTDAKGYSHGKLTRVPVDGLDMRPSRPILRSTGVWSTGRRQSWPHPKWTTSWARALIVST